MPRKPTASVDNNFSGGLKTEFTGLNFPENSCTDTSNCIFSKQGNVIRRKGINFEGNFELIPMTRALLAFNSFLWEGAEGGGLINLYVLQVGHFLYFFKSSSVSTSVPLSNFKLDTFVDLETFITEEGTLPENTECQFAAGNGHLFVFHPYLEPFYCTYDKETNIVSATQIDVKIRDVVGIEEAVEDTNRPVSLTNTHKYNLANQGWFDINQTFAGWTASSSSTLKPGTGTQIFTVPTGLSITVGDRVRAYVIRNAIYEIGIVSDYTVDQLTLTVSSAIAPDFTLSYNAWQLEQQPPLVNVWQSTFINYPSNADVWWYFKDADGLFNPAVNAGSVGTSSAPAPRGSYILAAWNQDRSTASGISGLDVVTTNGLRPKTGAWFQGRVWYAGVDFMGFNERIYFSQIVERNKQFGYCYQTNDPTSEERFDLLPSDGGVIVIQGAGIIHKLFPIQNGMLVFASNGIWFITGSQGIGFTANDYTVVKISGVQSISASSFISVLGLPMWWNEEGIYSIRPNQNGLEAVPLTTQSIASFYDEIPLSSKLYARGDYNPLSLTVQWAYRNSEEHQTNDRYAFDRILNYDTGTNAFFPWSVSNRFSCISDIKYIAALGGPNTPLGMFKYLSSANSGLYVTFSEEKDTDYVDWASSATGEENFDSYFISGYKLHGGAVRKFQPEYVYMYVDNTTYNSYYLQGIWNFSRTSGSGRFTVAQKVTQGVGQDDFDYVYRRFRIRGNGVSFQIKVYSVDGQGFNIIGWGITETQDAGV